MSKLALALYPLLDSNERLRSRFACLNNMPPIQVFTVVVRLAQYNISKVAGELTVENKIEVLRGFMDTYDQFIKYLKHEVIPIVNDIKGDDYQKCLNLLLKLYEDPQFDAITMYRRANKVLIVNDFGIFDSRYNEIALFDHEYKVLTMLERLSKIKSTDLILLSPGQQTLNAEAKLVLTHLISELQCPILAINPIAMDVSNVSTQFYGTSQQFNQSVKEHEAIEKELKQIRAEQNCKILFPKSLEQSDAEHPNNLYLTTSPLVESHSQPSHANINTNIDGMCSSGLQMETPVLKREIGETVSCTPLQENDVSALNLIANAALSVSKELENEFKRKRLDMPRERRRSRDSKCTKCGERGHYRPRCPVGKKKVWDSYELLNAELSEVYGYSEPHVNPGDDVVKQDLKRLSEYKIKCEKSKIEDVNRWENILKNL